MLSALNGQREGYFEDTAALQEQVAARAVLETPIPNVDWQVHGMRAHAVHLASAAARPDQRRELISPRAVLVSSWASTRSLRRQDIEAGHGAVLGSRARVVEI